MSAGTEAAGVVQAIPAGAIVAGDNDRKQFDPAALEELAASIEANGLAQPPTLRPLPAGLDGARYEIVAGERRVRAMRDVLGWSEIPALVRDLDDAAAAAIMLVENVQRVDLDPLEEARAYQARIDRFGGGPADVAAVAGVGVSRVRARLALLKLAPDVARFVSNKDLPISFAQLMTPLDSNRQFLALAAYQAAPISLDAFRALCSRLVAEQDQEAMFSADDFLRVEEYVIEANRAVKVPEAEAVIVRERVVGPDEAARMLGVKPRTVHQWRHRGIFPAPDLQVGATPAWWESTVTDWAADTGRALQAEMTI